jgi:hypothetical protein
MLVRIGETIVAEVTFERKVNGVLQRYDPGTVKCSFLHADATEETKVYAGSDPDDADVVRLATGSYESPYLVAVAEDLRIEWLATDTVGAKTWPSKSRSSIVRVAADPHTFTDLPAPTP